MSKEHFSDQKKVMKFHMKLSAFSLSLLTPVEQRKEATSNRLLTSPLLNLVTVSLFAEED